MYRKLLVFCLSLLFSGLVGPNGPLYAQAPQEEQIFTVWAKDSAFNPNKTAYKGIRPRIGVVLSGGGAKGIAHVGALKVIEELDIPIDYIGGTSMGGIIGGLYAYGYSARELDSILRAVDWSILLNDKPDWTDVFYEDKKNYMLSLPFSFKGNNSITPVGFLKGQHLYNVFYTLSSQSYQYRTFKDFNIPYFCTVANIVNGQAIYIDSGNLALSMRSSMAVPGVFAPVRMDTMLLVDGGVVNNFPVDVMRQKGADIIIGVDVTFSYAGTEHVNSFLDVLEEVVFMGSKGKMSANRNECDIYIRPDIMGFTSSSFGKTDSLLAIGEAAARKSETYANLKLLAERLHHYQPEPPKDKKPYLPPEQVYITRIEYEGLHIYNQNYISQFLQVESGKWVKLNDILEGINRIYGTLVFKSVAYEFRKDETKRDGTVLVIRVEEAPLNTFNVGVRFDNDRSAALLAGLKFRNLGFKNSTLTADVELSNMITAKIDYMIRPGWKPGKRKFSSLWMPSLGLGLEYYHLAEDLYRDPDNYRKASVSISSNRYRARIYGQSNWKRNILGFGAYYEFTDNNKKLTKAFDRGDIFDNSYFIPYFYFRHDSYNKKAYPTKGSRMNLEINFPVRLNKSTSTAGKAGAAGTFLSAYWTADFAIGIGAPKRFCLYPGFTLGSILFRNKGVIPVQQQFFQGSNSDMPGWYSSALPGVMLGQSSGYEIINLRLTAQIMIIKNLYLSLRGGVGKAEYELLDMIRNFDHIVYGGNIGISYDTPVGPVGLSFETSNIHNFNVYLNIGYWF